MALTVRYSGLTRETRQDSHRGWMPISTLSGFISANQQDSIGPSEDTAHNGRYVTAMRERGMRICAEGHRRQASGIAAAKAACKVKG
jgi:hypothetical protein